MKRSIVSCLIVSIFTMLTSCSTVEMIKRNMDYKSVSMTYEMDSVPPVTKKKDINLWVAPVKFDPTMMNKTTVMNKDKRFLYPLVIFNIWERYDTCIQGINAYKDDIPTFLQTTLVTEINYSGSITAKADIQSDYTLELTVDNLRTEGPYQRSGMTFLFFLKRLEVAGPAISRLKVTYTLKKGNQVVKQNTISTSKSTVWPKRKYASNALMQMDYSVSMVNATAQNIKKTNKLIVDDLDDYFRRQN